MSTALTFIPEEIPESEKGVSSRKGEGVWQLTIKEFLSTHMESVRIDIGERNYKSAYGALSGAIRKMGLHDEVQAVIGNSTEAVYLRRIPVE